MPDITVSFTDAQWARVVAASPYIKRIDDPAAVDAAYLIALWRTQVSEWVKEYERQQASTDEF